MFKLLHVEYTKNHFNIVWGLKFILFYTKKEGMCPRGFGFIIHEDTDLFFEKTSKESRIGGIELVLLCRPFPPFGMRGRVEWLK